MKNLSIIAASILCASAVHGAEFERTQTPTPTVTPVVAPAPIQGAGIGLQLDAALSPSARVETSNEALANVSAIMQGGSAQATPASAVATGNSTLLEESRDASAPKGLPLAASTAKASSPAKDLPRPATKKDSSERALHLTAALVIVAVILSYAFLIKGFGEYVNGLENQIQQQIHEADDWGR